MNILKRPGWAHHELLNEVKRGSGHDVVGKEKFVKALAGSQFGGIERMQTPHQEAYRFVAQVIMDDEELSQHFPAVTAPYKLRSHHFAGVAPEVIKTLQDRLEEIYNDNEKFTHVLRMLHASRKAATTQELEARGRVDTREKTMRWKKAFGGPEAEAEPEGPPAREEDLTPQELANVDRAQFQVSFAPLYAKIPLDSGETVGDVMNDHPELMDIVMGSQDIFDMLEKLASVVASGEPVAEVAEEIYDKLKTKLVKGAETMVSDVAGKGMPEELGAYFAGKHKTKKGEPEMDAKKDSKYTERELNTVGAAADKWLHARGLLSKEDEEQYKQELQDRLIKGRREAFPESAKLTAKQVDKVLLEQRRKAAQYRTIMEERYGR